MIINNDKIGEKNIIMKGIKCNIYLTTQSSLTRFILLNKRKDIKYTTDFSQSLTYVKIFFEKINESFQAFKSLPYSTLKILFRTENMHIPVLYSQYNEEKDETSFLIRYMYSNINIPSKLSEKLDKGDINDLQMKLQDLCNSKEKVFYIFFYPFFRFLTFLPDQTAAARFFRPHGMAKFSASLISGTCT
jgi:hypothetical protein